MITRDLWGRKWTRKWERREKERKGNQIYSTGSHLGRKERDRVQNDTVVDYRTPYVIEPLNSVITNKYFIDFLT